MVVLRSVSNDAKNYHRFYTMFGLKQIIKSPTLMTCRNTSLTDHILANILSQISNQGDHQLIYCTQTHKFSLVYKVYAYKDALKKFDFPNYELFNNVNEAYSNFFQKIRTVIDNIAPCKTNRVKANTRKWFDGEILKYINTRDKLFKRF